MNLNEVINLIENTYPLSLQEKWDCSGLQIDIKKEIKKIVVTLGISNDIVEYALDNDVDMIISHHPLIFRNYYQSYDYIRNMYQTLYSHNIAIYSMHTNYDNHPKGMNYQFVKQLSYDIVNVKDSLITFNVDKYLISNIKKITNDAIKVYNEKENYNKASVLLGAGGDFVDKLTTYESSVLISSEFKHHEILYALENDITLIDVNHQAEIIFVEDIAKFLNNNLSDIDITMIKEKYEINLY